jgi:cold shock CspA family protein
MFGWFKKKPPALQTCEATVTRWQGTYGFLTRGPGTDRIFVHKSKLPEGVSRLETGTPVQVEFSSGEKGPAAEKVTLL